MDRFIAIDVETANFEPTSICAIGAVKVEAGLITDRRYSLVCPEPDWFSPACVRVHGIPLKDHHCALDDAEACAKLAIILL